MPGASSRHVSQNGDQNQNIKGFSPLTTDRRLTSSPVAASNIWMSGTSSEIAVAGGGAVVVVAGIAVVVTGTSVVVVAGAAVVVTGGAVVVVVVVSAAAVVVVDGSVVATVSSTGTAVVVVVVVAAVEEVVTGSVAPVVVVADVPEVLATVATVSVAVVAGLSGAGVLSMAAPVSGGGGVVAGPVVLPPHDMTAPASSATAMTEGMNRKSAPRIWGISAGPGYRQQTTRFRDVRNRAST